MLRSCTWCAERQVEGLPPMCEYECPTEALAYGEETDPESPYSRALARCTDKHYHVFELPDYENSRQGVTYAVK